MDNKTIQIIAHILRHCEEIELANEFFGNNYEIFKSNVIYRNSVCMSFLQIGELSNKLDNQLKKETEEVINWNRLRAIRNYYAHEYQEIDIKRVWTTLERYIPKIKDFCEEQLEIMEALELKK